VIGHFHGHKSGHSLNNKLVRALLADEDAFEIVSFDQPRQVPEAYARNASLREL
jgi:UDP-3-O-[3-hydroxymyristoyl] N-acetylglucosamine deacetylase